MDRPPAAPAVAGGSTGAVPWVVLVGGDLLGPPLERGGEPAAPAVAGGSTDHPHEGGGVVMSRNTEVLECVLSVGRGFSLRL